MRWPHWKNIILFITSLCRNKSVKISYLGYKITALLFTQCSMHSRTKDAGQLWLNFHIQLVIVAWDYYVYLLHVSHHLFICTVHFHFSPSCLHFRRILCSDHPFFFGKENRLLSHPNIHPYVHDCCNVASCVLDKQRVHPCTNCGWYDITHLWRSSVVLNGLVCIKMTLSFWMDTCPRTSRLFPFSNVHSAFLWYLAFILFNVQIYFGRFSSLRLECFAVKAPKLRFIGNDLTVVENEVGLLEMKLFVFVQYY